MSGTYNGWSMKKGTLPSLVESCTLVSSAELIKNHIDLICAIETASFDPPWKKSDFMHELESCGSRNMVLLEKGNLVGYLFSKIAADELTINKLCIHPDWRGRGYGGLLMKSFIVEIGRHFSTAFLEVDSANTPAVRLYTRCGFRIGRIRKGVYSSGADALEMMLDMKQQRYNDRGAMHAAEDLGTRSD